MKKTLSLALCTVMCVASFSTAAFARDWSGDKDTVYVTEDSAREYHRSAYADDTDGATISNESERGKTYLQVGETRDLSSKVVLSSVAEEWKILSKIQWSSSNPDIAEVDENGVVTAKTSGWVRITASGWDNKSHKQVQTITVEISDSAFGAAETPEEQPATA